MLRQFMFGAAVLCVAHSAAAGTLVINGQIDDTDPSLPAVLISEPACTVQGSFQVRYDAHRFAVSQAGAYSFSNAFASEALSGRLVSMYLFSGAFDPTSPLASCLAGDNRKPIGLTQSLLANTEYVFVLFDDTFAQAFDEAYTATIEGPGDIRLVDPDVPEPVTLTLLAVGAGLAGVSRRRRR